MYIHFRKYTAMRILMYVLMHASQYTYIVGVSASVCFNVSMNLYI